MGSHGRRILLRGLGESVSLLGSVSKAMMSRLLSEFLKASKGRMIFIGVAPTPGGNKAGSEGILEDYDEKYVVLRSENWLMVTAIDSIISFEVTYTNLNLAEVVAA